MLSASSYGHFTATKEFRSQCHIFRFESRLVGRLVGNIERVGSIEKKFYDVLKCFGCVVGVFKGCSEEIGF